MTKSAAAPDAVSQSGKIGVLVVNLGTPDALGYWPVRRYLKEFLWDPRVVDTPRLIWWPILNLIILSRRPQRSSKNYETIWNTELNESPLKTVTRSQAEKLAAWIESGGLGARRASIAVEWAMRYGQPSITSGFQKLKEQSCERILVVPLYPQYAGATTESVADKVEQSLAKMRWRPELRSAAPYYNDAVYIDALATSVREGVARLDFTPEIILVSFHGIPKSYVEAGDPYYDQCVETWRLLREQLDLTPELCPLTFQSRFGPKQWLQPYTDETVKALARQGVKRMAVLTPGFSVDCLETISEIGIENREFFEENGGEKLALIPCLNDSALGMRVIQSIVERELSGWIEAGA
ncbi:ferrochelatase [Methylocella tundrae]|uniref:Ferrochelatase n=1 Tax=Methylocella tundrae TaxID=227605 RepID=A0A4U8Z1G9_METTU|nr:ferrochelatase [Methylocella tundrae]WPP03163.1 ferrochelatase [Methylocella tundrae]VFU09147.1 Ferrochelatase [Methylocella tundrae]